MKRRYTEKKITPQILGKKKKQSSTTRKFCSPHCTQFTRPPHESTPSPETKTSPKREKENKKQRDNPFLFPFPRDACLTFVHFLLGLGWLSLGLLLVIISCSVGTGANDVIVLTGLDIFVVDTKGFVDLRAESWVIIKTIKEG